MTTRADVVHCWEQAAEEAAALGAGKVIVLGATDVGKSSFCRFLCLGLRDRGHNVAWVDADIGQKQIGPPAAVTSCHLSPDGLDLNADSQPTGFHFVGSTDPMGRFLPLVVGTARLASRASAEFVVVDTTGLIHGSGRALKAAKLDALRPDLVVAIEREQELSAILAGNGLCRAVRVPAPPTARPKTQRERERARQASFARYFRAAEELTLSVEQIVLQNTLLFSGAPVALAVAIHAERTAERLVAVAEEQDCRDLATARVVRPGFEGGLLCGLADAAGDGLGLGIVEAIDFPRRQIRLFSPVARERIAAVQFGYLYLAKDGRELGRVSQAMP